MNVWAWVGVGSGGFLLMSALVAVAVARILSHIAAEASALLELEAWALAPLARDEEQDRAVERKLATARGDRTLE